WSKSSSTYGRLRIRSRHSRRLTLRRVRWPATWRCSRPPQPRSRSGRSTRTRFSRSERNTCCRSPLRKNYRTGKAGMIRKIKRYGWRPQLPDKRDLRFVAHPRATPLPPYVDLRQSMPAVYDQGELGSCTANAISAALEYQAIREGLPDKGVPSRLFIYYNERVMEGDPGTDAGAQIRD